MIKAMRFASAIATEVDVTFTTMDGLSWRTWLAIAGVLLAAAVFGVSVYLATRRR